MQKHPHYFKDVSKFTTIDVYRVLSLFNVTDPCIQHAVKKLLVAGGRGAGKDISQDIKEAVDSLQRWDEMQKEDTQLTLMGKEYEIAENGFDSYEDLVEFYRDNPSTFCFSITSNLARILLNESRNFLDPRHLVFTRIGKECQDQKAALQEFIQAARSQGGPMDESKQAR